MEAIAYIIFILVSFGPLVAYAIYTARHGEPRRPERPAKGKGTIPGTAAS
jgi:hypothetical protein